MSALVAAGEGDIHGRGNLHAFAGEGQLAAAAIDAENFDVVGVLIGDQEIVSGRIDDEVAGGFAASEKISNGGEDSGLWIDGKDGDAVAATVGNVQKFPRRMHGDFRSVVGTVEIGGQC